jgi:hypothetical protein
MSFINKYIYTIKSLFTEPRQVIDTFLHGKSDAYLHPFKLCLTGVLLVILINTVLLDFSFEPVAGNVPAELKSLRQMTEWTQIVSVRAATQFLPLSLFLLFVVSLAIGAMFFLRRLTNGFFDHIIINTYSVGVALIFLPLLIPVWGLSGLPLTDPFINSTVPAMVVAGVIIWIYNLYFRPTGFMEWIRVLSAYITGFVIYVLLSGLVNSVIAYSVFVIERISQISG